MKKPLKTISVILVSLGAIFLVLISIFALWIPSRKIATYEKTYVELTKGTSKQQVLAEMGVPTKIGVLPTEYWDEVKLDIVTSGGIVETLEYSINTFFMPVTYCFSFNKSSQLIGKHRY